MTSSEHPVFISRLINEILFAREQTAIIPIIQAHFGEVDRMQKAGLPTPELVETILHHLTRFSPLDLDAHQWSNIKLAKIQLARIRRSLQHEPEIKSRGQL